MSKSYRKKLYAFFEFIGWFNNNKLSVYVKSELPDDKAVIDNEIYIKPNGDGFYCYKYGFNKEKIINQLFFCDDEDLKEVVEERKKLHRSWNDSIITLTQYISAKIRFFYSVDTYIEKFFDDPDFLKKMIKNGYKNDKKLCQMIKDNWNPFFIIYRNKFNHMHYLIEKKLIDLNNDHITEHGDLCLTHAVFEKKKKMVKLLLRAGADPEIEDGHGHDSYFCNKMMNDYDIKELLYHADTHFSSSYDCYFNCKFCS